MMTASSARSPLRPLIGAPDSVGATDLFETDMTRIPPALQGTLNGEWIQFGVQRAQTGSTEFLVRAENWRDLPPSMFQE